MGPCFRHWGLRGEFPTGTDIGVELTFDEVVFGRFCLTPSVLDRRIHRSAVQRATWLNR